MFVSKASVCDPSRPPWGPGCSAPSWAVPSAAAPCLFLRGLLVGETPENAVPGSSCSLPIQHVSRDEECRLFSSFTHWDSSSQSIPLLSSSQRCIPGSWMGRGIAGQPQKQRDGVSCTPSMAELQSLLDLCLRRLYCLVSQQSPPLPFPDAHVVEWVMYSCVSTVCNTYGTFYNGSFSFGFFPDTCWCFSKTEILKARSRFFCPVLQGRMLTVTKVYQCCSVNQG